MTIDNNRTKDEAAIREVVDEGVAFGRSRGRFVSVVDRSRDAALSVLGHFGPTFEPEPGRGGPEDLAVTTMWTADLGDETNGQPIQSPAVVAGTTCA
jgi:hypothetical protein